MVGKALKNVTVNPDGSWTATLPDASADKAAALRLLEMTEESRSLDYDIGQNLQSQHDARDRFAAADERGRKRRGERPSIYWGRPSYRCKFLPDGTKVEL